MGLIRDIFLGPKREREVVVTPLEGTNMSLFHSIIPNWWTENGLSGGQFYGTASLAEQVWVANRCQQLNSQQISSMPLQWYGPASVIEPAWVSNPDPNLFPNGIGDALFAIVNQLYGWGYSLQYVTDFYADGFPRTWTVIPSAACTPVFEDGRRVYKIGDTPLDPRRVVQIDRNPTTAAHGTSALRAYAQNAWQLQAAGNQAMTVSQGGIPQSVLKSQRKLTKEQAETLQEQWMTATSNRNGAPPVLPPELDFSVLSINPADLALLETQEWNARVLATAYGVPSVILNMALQGGLTYQNPIALMQMWWMTELRTTSKRIMDAFTAQMLPRGQWVAQDATDITLEGSIEGEDDPQLSQVAKASPAQQPRPLTAIGGGG
jgi:HK97 family phage portal protein